MSEPDPWRCKFEKLHAVPSLAARCDGSAHGLEPAEPVDVIDDLAS